MNAHVNTAASDDDDTVAAVAAAAPPSPTLTTSRSSSISPSSASLTTSDAHELPGSCLRRGSEHDVLGVDDVSSYALHDRHRRRRHGWGTTHGANSTGRHTHAPHNDYHNDDSCEDYHVRAHGHAGSWARQSNTRTLFAQHGDKAALPESPKQLMAQIIRQRDAMRLMQEDNMRLRAREVEVSALALRLQQHFASTQSQIDRIKAQIHLQLAQPISDADYARIESMEEKDRDLLDTIKLGIHRQLGSMRGSQLSAVRRAAELTDTVATLSEELTDVRQQLSRREAVRQAETEAMQNQRQQCERQGSRVLELEATVRDLESRLRGVHMQQEQFLTAKLTAQMKTEEVVKLGVRLEEVEVESERHRMHAACSEQKLDILKTEFYQMKLDYSQRVMELEAALRASEEKLRTVADVELESELFITHLARSSEGTDGLLLGDCDMVANATSAEEEEEEESGSPSGSCADVRRSRGAQRRRQRGGITEHSPSAGHGALHSLQAWPRSRAMTHALTVTKRCLQLENRLASLQHDVDFKNDQIGRLQCALAGAREALHKVNSPYVLVEKTLTELSEENERLRERVRQETAEKAALTRRLRECQRDLTVLGKHRRELLRMKRALDNMTGARVGSTVKSHEAVNAEDRNADEEESCAANADESTTGEFVPPAGEGGDEPVAPPTRRGAAKESSSRRRRERAESLSSSQLTNASAATALPAINIQS